MYNENYLSVNKSTGAVVTISRRATLVYVCVSTLLRYWATDGQNDFILYSHVNKFEKQPEKLRKAINFIIDQLNKNKDGFTTTASRYYLAPAYFSLFVIRWF
jgi:hypothetical protein